MAADYTEAPAAPGGWPDDRQRPSDERLLAGAAYVNPAQRRGRPSASRASDARPARIAHDDCPRRRRAPDVAKHGRAVGAAPAGTELVIGPVADDRPFELRRMHIKEWLGRRALRRVLVVEIDEYHPAGQGRPCCTGRAAPAIRGLADHDGAAAFGGLAARELHGQHPGVHVGREAGIEQKRAKGRNAGTERDGGHAERAQQFPQREAATLVAWRPSMVIEGTLRRAGAAGRQRKLPRSGSFELALISTPRRGYTAQVADLYGIEL